MQSQSKAVAICAATNNAVGVEPPGPWEPTSCYSVPHLPDMNTLDLMSALLGFSFALVWSLLVIFMFLPFEMGMFTLCHFILEVWNLIFDSLQQVIVDFILGLRCATLLQAQKQWGQSIIDQNLQNCEPNKPFLFISWSRVFCYSDGKLICLSSALQQHFLGLSFLGAPTTSFIDLNYTQL